MIFGAPSKPQPHEFMSNRGPGLPNHMKSSGTWAQKKKQICIHSVWLIPPQFAPRWPQDTPMWGQEANPNTQVGSKMAQEFQIWRKQPHTKSKFTVGRSAPTWSQDGLKGSQEPTNWSQNNPETSQLEAKMVPNQPTVEPETSGLGTRNHNTSQN